MRVRLVSVVAAVGCVGLVSARALAQPGHVDIGLGGGLMHPVTGVDHMLMLLAVGAWSAQMGKRAMWLMPAAYRACMLIGANLAFSGGRAAPTAVDQVMIAWMVFVGMVIAGAFRLLVAAGVPLA